MIILNLNLFLIRSRSALMLKKLGYVFTYELNYLLSTYLPVYVCHIHANFLYTIIIIVSNLCPT